MESLSLKAREQVKTFGGEITISQPEWSEKVTYTRKDLNEV